MTVALRNAHPSIIANPRIIAHPHIIVHPRITTIITAAGFRLRSRRHLRRRSFTSTTAATASPSSAARLSAASLAHSFTKLETERKL